MSILSYQQYTRNQMTNHGTRLVLANARIKRRMQEYLVGSKDIRSLMSLFQGGLSCYFAVSFALDGGLFSDLAFFLIGLPLDESSVVIICSLVGLVKLSLTTSVGERGRSATY